MESKKISVFDTTFELKQTLISSFGTEECYVFLVSRNATNSKIAAANSNKKIKLYDTETLSIIGSLEGHTDTINDVKFAKTHNDVLFSCSSDCTLRIWDTRTLQQGPCYKGSSEFFSFDTSNDESQISSAFSTSIYLWDLRSTKQLRELKEFHGEDITQIKYHPSHSNYLISGSMDGTVCLFDLQQSEEDDVLLSSINLADPVSQVYVYGNENQYLACLSHSERLSVWTLDGSRVFSLEDVRSSTSTDDFTVNYCVNMYTDPDKLYIGLGNFEGGFGIATLSSSFDLQLQSYILGSHNSLIRNWNWDRQNGRMYTCSEDSRICVWDLVNDVNNTNTNNNEMSLDTNFSRKEASDLRKEFKGAHEKKPY